MAQAVKNLPSNEGDAGDKSSIPESRRSPGGGNGNLLQYSCWEIPSTEEPGRLQSMGSERVGHDWVTEHTHTHTRKHRLFRNQCSDTSENSTNRMLEITNLVLEKTKTFVFYQHSFSKKTSQLTGQSEHALKSQWIWEACQPKFHTHVHACIHTHTHSVPHCLFCRMPQDGHTRVPSPWSLGPVSDLLLSYPGIWHVVGAQ